MQESWSNLGGWKTLIDQLPGPAYLSSRQAGGNPSYVNAALVRLLGYRIEDYTADPSLWKNLIHAADRVRVDEARARPGNGDGSRQITYWLATRDDRLINVIEQLACVDATNNGDTPWIGLLTDLTGHTSELRDDAEVDSTYRHMVEQTSDLVVRVDAEGHFLYVSPSYCDLFGKREQELLGRKFMPLVHEDDRETTERAMLGLLEPPHHAYMEQRAMTRHGWRWLAWTDNAVVDDQGQIVSIVGVGRDITESRRLAAALKTSEQRLHAVLNYASIGHWELASDRTTAEWSDEAYALLGIDRSYQPGPETLRRLVHANDWHRVQRSLYEALTLGKEHHVDYRVRRPDGEQRWIACRAKPIFDGNGKVIKLQGFIQDITERKRTEARIKQNEERFRLIATATNDLIYEWDSSSYVLQWHGDIDRALGYAPGAFPRTLNAWVEAIHPADRATVNAAVERIRLEGGTVDIEYRIAAADGSWRVWQDKGRTLQGEDGQTELLIGGCTDITARKQAEEKIQHLAFHDSLTGLPNRLLFREELQQVLEGLHRDGSLFALHYLDLDHFKDINDSLGHQFGDELLCNVAERIATATRGVDLFARLGGDEFGLIQTGINDASAASVLADKIIETISNEFRLLGQTVHISTSVGIVVPDNRDLDADELLKRADTALYKAKDAGRGTFAFFHDHMTTQLQQELELVTALSMAIPNEQLLVEFQPQYEIATRRLIGLEALVRWQHPRFGVIPPARFLPAAEKRCLDREISEWVLMTACEQAANWHAQGYTFGRIAVNLSGMQVDSDDFLSRILRIIDITGIAPENLEFEFTETVLMRATERSKGAILRLSDLGVNFAIDDFGTGFSSLSYLKNFHADKIKIDQEFVRDVNIEPNDAEIVKATIALGRALGLKTLAEGVENMAQLAFLEDNGCDQAQGFLLSRPLSAAGVDEILRAGAMSKRTAKADGSG